ncbi:acyltransferase domain-containing protein [Dactylosporangium matsuzakiense]|uniref:acyltransferase domain-containing protein n=1 Tax=Dactylosporangium matsuzakiense TaxID=53360 RepID=UPI0021C3AF5C|nr:acyltransferase domain-containing protein [Dactylosporangium matsuzakiense]UWZ43543.1 acyltransferase domain-containing protein [Dactylosporangium matsuzakiense]
MLAVLAPGQGSQKPGFLNPWLALPGAEARLRWWSALSGVDLLHLGTDADEEEIKDTAKTQPLLVAAALLAAEHLPMHDAAVVAGHSVGELAASALAGVLSPEAAVTLAGVRGREMAAACALEPTGMAAVLGGDPDEVVAAIDAAGLHPANRNGAGQIVAAGSMEGLDKFAAEPPAKAKVIRLKVAGAFHTPFMAPAEAALGRIAAGIPTGTPDRILLSNLDGTAVDHGPTMVRRLVRQITAPVRWDLCMETFAALGVTAVVELTPAGTLAGLAKRALKGIEIVQVNTPADLAKARDAIGRHGGAAVRFESSAAWVAVAGTSGRFVRSDLAEGSQVEAGQVIGAVDSVDVAAPAAGVLTEWLARTDEPVASGRPLARIGGQA